MKANALRIGKAISAALFVLLLVVVGSKNALAQTQVATLQHGDDVSAFYGMNAFVEAHTAAVDGDIITLSSGTFTQTNITKAITLRGAGCIIDTVTETHPTIIPNNFLISGTNNEAFLTIEGIYFSGTVYRGPLNHPKFIKCNFENFAGSGNMQNAQFFNCKINSFDFSGTSNTTLINSVVWNSIHLNASSDVILYNSIATTIAGSFYGFAYNSIIIMGMGGIGTSSLFNCIGVNLNYLNNPWGSAYTSNCMVYNSYDAVFETFDGTFSIEELFVLRNEIATGFFGTDGTQVGIYGGIMPYTSIPGYMLRTNVSVPNQSNIDGTLNVEIEVIDEDQ